MSEQLKGLLLMILGGLFVISMIKGLFSLGFKKVDTPRNYLSYASAGMRGRDPFNGPSKPLISVILGGLGTLILWILGIPQKIAKWALSKSGKLKKHVKWMSYTIATMFWLIMIVLVF